MCAALNVMIRGPISSLIMVPSPCPSVNMAPVTLVTLTKNGFVWLSSAITVDGNVK